MDGAEAGAAVSVQAEDFDPGAEQARLVAGRHDIGAVVAFTGLAREIADGGPGQRLTLEHWPGVTERALAAIAAEAEARWPLSGVRIVHRHGPLAPGDRIVLVLAASRHRQAAFEAAAFMMDYLKTRAPFWKKEAGPSGEAWVDARESDDAAAARWSDDAAAGRRSDDAAGGRRSGDAAGGRRGDDAVARRRSDDTVAGRRSDDTVAGRRSDDAAGGRRSDDAAAERRSDDTAAG
ncbi:MAG: molybdenum cofactor biosynthesis protein MoaE [Pseudomonadota bacterium]